MSVTIISGGEVVDRGRRQRLDLVVDDQTGTIVALAAGLEADGPRAGARVLDASGCLIGSGLVDLHAHLGQPGYESAETIESASRAAALGGFTAVVAMADTDPCTDSAAVVNEIKALAKSALCEVAPAGAITMGRAGQTLAPLGELADLGVRLFSDADHCIQDAGVLRRALEYGAGVAEATGAPLVLAQTCRLDALADRSVMHEGEWSSRLGLPGQPGLAEELIVTRELALARLTGARIHLQQISTAASVALVRAAKAEGVPVTAEVSPEHLVLTDAACAGFDPRYRLEPPLRTDADVAALRAGLADGTIDAVATAHRPCTLDAKEQPFDQAPPGVIGLETALAVMIDRAGLSIELVLDVASRRPAAIAGLDQRHGGPIAVGRPANLVVIDPAATWTFDAARSASRSANSAFDGATFTGRVRHTIAAGEPVVIDAEAQR